MAAHPEDLGSGYGIEAGAADPVLQRPNNQHNRNRNRFIAIAGTVAAAAIGGGAFLATHHTAAESSAPAAGSGLGKETKGTLPRPDGQNIILRAKNAGHMDLQTIKPTDTTSTVPWGRNGEQTILLPDLRDPQSDPIDFASGWLANLSYYFYTGDNDLASSLASTLSGGQPTILSLLQRQKDSFEASNPPSEQQTQQGYVEFIDDSTNPAEFSLVDDDGYGNKGVMLTGGQLFYINRQEQWQNADPKSHIWQSPPTGLEQKYPVTRLIIGYQEDPSNGQVTTASYTIDMSSIGQ